MIYRPGNRWASNGSLRAAFPCSLHSEEQAGVQAGWVILPRKQFFTDGSSTIVLRLNISVGIRELRQPVFARAYNLLGLVQSPLMN